MTYNVIVSMDAKEDLESFVRYILIEKCNRQAAANLLEDFEVTIKNLSMIAGSLKMCENSKLRDLGYRRINFVSHRYFMLYRIEESTVIVDNIFHELQDYEGKII